MGYEDVMVIEGVEGYEAQSEQEYAAAVQRQINAGQWSLQGSHGREMVRMIEAGHCMLGRTGARDYYGSYIPGRDEVQPGTKGSKRYVELEMGADWANAMEAV